MWNLKNYANEFIYKTEQTHRLQKQNYSYQMENMGGRDKYEFWMNIYIK